MMARHSVMLPRFTYHSKITCLAWALSLSWFGKTPAQDRLPPAELGEEAQQIRTELQDVGLRLQSLAKKVEATDAEDARRMLEAADKIHGSDVGRAIDEISTLLSKANFIEALSREEKVLEELDAILRILERTQFEKPEDLERKAEELRDLLRATGLVTKKQEGLLQKTKDFLDRMKALESLRDLQTDLSQIKEAQSNLNQGADPEKVAPGAEAADQKALLEAQETARRLKTEQEALNDRLSKLGGKNLPIADLRAIKEKLDALVADGEQLADAGEQARKAESERLSVPPSGDKSAGDKSAGDKSAGDKSAGDKSAGDKSAGDKSAPSEVELARRALEAKDAREELARQAEEFASRVGELSKDISQSGDVPQGAKDDVLKASSESQSAAKGFREDDLSKAIDKEMAALGDLKKARDQISRELAQVEEKNSAETAGLVQEQGKLEERAEAAASKASQSASQSSGESSRSALEQGSQSLSEASKAMEDAAQASQEGNREKAKSAGDRAKEELAKAEAAFSKGQKDLAQRSAAEKAADLQKKLARKSEETRKKAEELQKKLGKKGEENRGDKLAQAQDSLSKASSAMQESAGAQTKSQNELSKKKGEEALAALEKAQASLEDEERDELARLEKEKLKKTAPEQEELARLSKDLAKKAKSSSSGSESGDSSEQLSQASESMEEASDQLQKEDAEAAKKAQEEALAKLKNTKEQLKEEEERLARLKREQEMENLMASLTEVREKQEKVNSDTVKIDSGREKNESRRQRKQLDQKVESIVMRQGELADEVDTLNQKLKEEYARVFTFILKNVSADMRQVRDSLKELETGTYTQFLEREIVGDIDRLIAALREEMEKPEPNDGSPPPSGEMPQGKQRLVPTVAELRMLKGMQLDANKSTRDMEDLRKASGGNITDSWKRALDRLLQKQGSVSRMTGELIKDFKKAGQEGGGEEGAEPEADDHEDKD